MNLIDRAKKMLTTPKTEWLAVASETPDTSKVMTGYVVPFALIAAAAIFIGLALIGVYGFSSAELGIYAAIAMFVQLVLTILIAAFIVDAFAPTFNSEKSLGRSVQLLGYGSTAVFVACLAYIFPRIGNIFLILGAIYSAYLIYLGVAPLKKTPEDKQPVYTIICIGAMVGVYLIVNLIMERIIASILWGGYAPGFRINF